MKTAIRRQYRETKRNLHLRRHRVEIERAEIERHYRIMNVISEASKKGMK